MDFDTDLFISLIKSKVSIWNYKSQEYSDKIKRSNDWALVCESLIPNFAEKNNNEKNATVIELQGRWKVLRDGFMRSLKNQNKKSGSAAARFKTKLYTYHEQLLFLKDVMTDKGRRDSGGAGAGTSNKQSETTPDEIPTKKTKRRTNETSSDDIFIESLNKNASEKLSSVENDPDKQFLLCLLDDFKAIPTDDKLDAKSDIINVIRYYKNKTAHQYETGGNHSSHADYFKGYANATQYSRTVATDSTQVQDSNENRFQTIGITHHPYNRQSPGQSTSSPETNGDAIKRELL